LVSGKAQKREKKKGKLRRTVCTVLILHIQLAQTEIAKGDVTGIVKKDILGLEITVDNLETVQALERTQQLGGVEPGAVNVKSLLSLQVVEQLSTIDKCENKVQLLGRLEREFQRNNERVIDLCQHGSLCKGVGDFGSGDDMSLADGLEGVNSACIFLPVFSKKRS
jgi:hypothetical protein